MTNTTKTNKKATAGKTNKKAAPVKSVTPAPEVTPAPAPVNANVITSETTGKGYTVYKLNGKNFMLIEYSKKSARIYIHSRLEYAPAGAVANRATSKYAYRITLPRTDANYRAVIEDVKARALEVLKI